ncbi:MAG: extracellular solute-binding protein [Defluviitaleaceae bacterium]|nr:extracellular solute-binding protein [Defluviitaleaceae bacterium]
MKMRKVLLLCIIAAVALVLSAACSRDDDEPAAEATPEPAVEQQAEETPEPEPVTDDNEFVTLRVFSMAANTSGLMDNTYWGELIRQDLNLVIELLPAGDEADSRLAVLMASRDLPDITVFRDNPALVTDAIEAGFLINLDDHHDAIPNVLANAPMALQFMRDSISLGTGNAYAVPNRVTNQANIAGSVTGPYLRWDLYMELGMPQMIDLEDYLEVIAQMLDLEPENPFGQSNFGFSIFSDWDGNVSWPVRIITEYFGVTQDGFGFSEVNFANNNQITSIYDDNSYFRRAIHFLNQAHQMGIMDPDIITDTFSDYIEKANAGRVLFQLMGWTSWAYETEETRNSMRSYMGVFFENQRKLFPAPPFVGDSNWTAVSATSNHPDRALALLNYMYCYDALWHLAWGPQGIAWDLNPEGKPFRTALGWEMGNNHIPFENGGLISEGLNLMNWFGMPWHVTHPRFNARMDELDWPSTEYTPPDFAVFESWRSITGAFDSMEYAAQRGLYTIMPFVPPLPPMPDDLQRILDQVSAENYSFTYRMILAANDAEFDALWDELVHRAYGMGAQEVNDWVVEQFEISLAEGARYMY